MAKSREGKGLMALLMLLMMLIAAAACAITALTPKRYDVGLGTIAEETITATRTIEDSATTEALREAARNGTEVVYRLDEALAAELIAGAEGFFQDISAFRQEAHAKRLENIAGSGLRADGSLSIPEWQSILSAAELNALLDRFVVPLSEEQGWWLLYVEDTEILRLQDAVLPKLTTALTSGLEAAAVEARRSAYLTELNATSISDALKGIGEAVFDTYLVPTFIEDEVATEQAREAAAAEVEAVEIKRGDVIVEEGQAISEEQLVILRSLELVRAEGEDLKLDIGILLYLLAVFAAFAAYLLLYARRVAGNAKSMLIIGLSVTIALLLSLLASLLDARITPMLYATMLVALLVDRRAAMAVNIVLALCAGLSAGGRGSSMLGVDATIMTASVLIAGQTAVYLLGRRQRRSAIIASGAIAGAAGALVTAALSIMLDRSIGALLMGAAFALGSNVIAAVLVVGTLAVWENVFDIATSARLNELSNANHPLLKQLMKDAPGTYHHSMMTASLAESAAEAIGADPLLARVGGYYHDVGKLRRPLYFAENQKGENIHDTLPAQESASIIIAHQKDGVALLTKYKLPAAVVEIAHEHHGNTLVAYFYHKATQEAGGKAPQQKSFRYPGARPSSAESAIVMLADSCEAAVRSLSEPDGEAVEAMVHKVIKGKLDDGQLAASPLTFAEIAEIERAFLRAFGGLLHERIEYPEQQKRGGKA